VIPPLLHKIRQQQIGRSPLQHPSNPRHGKLQAGATAIRQQLLQLRIRQGHMGAHQHQSRQGLAGGIPAPQAGQPRRGKGLRTEGHLPGVHQAIDQARSGAEQQTPAPLQPAHSNPEGIQLLRALGIHHHRRVVPQG